MIDQNRDGFVDIEDSMGRYPMDVAVELNLRWDEGMKEIVEAFVLAQASNPVNVCAKHGLAWENGMKNVVEESEIGDMNEQEKMSDLYPFMIAGVGPQYDLGSIYQMIRKSPGTVQRYGDID